MIASGRRFAIARLSDGTYLDTTFNQNWQQMGASGIIRGAYQFFEPGEDPLVQANIMLSKAGTLSPGDLPPALDVEVTGGQSVTGRTPLVYTSPGFWDASVAGQTFSTDLWVAHWNVSSPGTLPVGWSSWRFWQYSDAGQVAGISGAVDLDRFNGSLANLEAYAGLLPGDANRDGTVNFSDLVVLARNYGRQNASWDQGDFNFDGSVGFDDLTALARNYGRHATLALAADSTPGELSQIPEPSAAWLLPLAAALATRSRP